MSKDLIKKFFKTQDWQKWAMIWQKADVEWHGKEWEEFIETIKANPKLVKPQKGYHNCYCFMCGKLAGRVIHYGGERKLSWCEYCKDIPHYCPECYLKERKNVTSTT